MLHEAAATHKQADTRTRTHTYTHAPHTRTHTHATHTPHTYTHKHTHTHTTRTHTQTHQCQHTVAKEHGQTNAHAHATHLLMPSKFKHLFHRPPQPRRSVAKQQMAQTTLYNNRKGDGTTLQDRRPCLATIPAEPASNDGDQDQEKR